jgi:hypothetical protein
MTSRRGSWIPLLTTFLLGACGASGGTNAGGEPGSSGESGSGASSSGQSSSGAGGGSSSGGTASGAGTSSGGSPGGPSSGTAGDDSGVPGSGSGTGDGDSGTSGDDSGPTGDDSGGGPPAAGSYTCFPAGSGTDFTSNGPLTATSADVTSVSCTIFQPTVLGAKGCLNPVVVWGNGTINTPSTYTALFNHWATHGIITVAADTSNAGSGKEMLACLSYIIAQNTAAGSAFNGHIDVNNIASSGYSQGGAGCLEAGIDPRFKVLAAVSPFVEIALGGYDTSSPMKQIHPLFMISGSADTVAVPSANQEPIFMQAPVPIFWATHAGSTHFEVLGNGGAYAGPLTAWFRYKLMGDPAARAWFEKPTCTLCSATGWMVQTNSMWM